MPEPPVQTTQSGPPSRIALGFHVACGVPEAPGFDTQHQRFLRISLGWKPGGKEPDVDIVITLEGNDKSGKGAPKNGDDTPDVAAKIQAALEKAAKDNSELASHLKDTSVETDGGGPGDAYGRLVVDGATHVDAGTTDGKLRLWLVALAKTPQGAITGKPPQPTKAPWPPPTPPGTRPGGSAGSAKSGPIVIGEPTTPFGSKFHAVERLYGGGKDAPDNPGYFVNESHFKRIPPTPPPKKELATGVLVLSYHGSHLTWDNQYPERLLHVPFTYVFDTPEAQAAEIDQRLRDAGVQTWRSGALVVPISLQSGQSLSSIGIEMAYDPTGAYGPFPWNMALIRVPAQAMRATGFGTGRVSPAPPAGPT